MRKKFTLAILANFSVFVYSQAQVLPKGDKLFGGSLSFSFYNNNNSGTFHTNSGNAGLLPSVGWAIKSNNVLGIRGSIAWSRSENKNTSSGKSIATSFSFGPGIFLKKYKTLKNKFGLYFDHSVNMNYAVNKEKNPPAINVSKVWGINYSFSPGVFYKFSEHFFGEANIGGVNASYSSGSNNSNISIGASFLQYFNLGINYRIPGRKS